MIVAFRCILIRATGHLSMYDGTKFVYDAFHSLVCVCFTTLHAVASAARSDVSRVGAGRFDEVARS